MRRSDLIGPAARWKAKTTRKGNTRSRRLHACGGLGGVELGRRGKSVLCPRNNPRKAVNAGFKVPRTCITCNKDRAIAFIETCGGRCVAKTLCSSLIEYPKQDYFVFTTLIENIGDIGEEEIGIAPIIFQEYLEGKIDYRITVVGAKAYAVRIQAPEGRSVPLDWRTDKEGLDIVPCTLPSDIHRKCIDFVSASGLVFGAIDLVETKGDFYFLEINPNGEWGWLQQSANLPIAETIAECLIEGRPACGTGTGSQFAL